MARRRLSGGSPGKGGSAIIREESGPAGAATGAALKARDGGDPTLFDLQPQAADGERRKLAALATLRARNPARVLAAQRAMVAILLKSGECTVEHVRAALKLPDGEPARWLGAVPGELRRAGIIRRAGYAETTRPVAHARPISVWELADRVAAMHWLAVHADQGA